MCPFPYVVVKVMRRSSIMGNNEFPHIQSGNDINNISWPNLYIIDIIHEEALLQSVARQHVYDIE
jgi:hypothetical protein